MICVPFPKVTHADLLLENESVILAREKAGEPYAFYSVEVLQGRLGPQDIEVFIPSNTLRRLRTSSEDAVVLMRRTAKSEWQYMTYADPEYQQFIRAILSNSGSWNGARVKSRRIAFFAGYLTRDHRSIREQAYLEVGRAPYASIKTIAGSVPREQIREFFNELATHQLARSVHSHAWAKSTRCGSRSYHQAGSECRPIWSHDQSGGMGHRIH